MKFFAVFAALFAVAAALPQFQKQPYRAVQTQALTSFGSDAVILKEQPHNNIGIGGYSYSYEQSDGQQRQETADIQLARSANEESILRVRGSFSWVNPTDGQTYTITYIADENGFQPQGAHLPVAPSA